MADPLIPVGDGHTELSDEDRNGLIPSYVSTRADLFDAEQRNIAEALRRSAPTTNTLLDDKYLRDLHKAMFKNVWNWAGRYRTRETNIGIDPIQIGQAVRSLVDDTLAWVEYDTYINTELAARFHHRLVEIHPFPNGNGRHGRVSADYLLSSMGKPRFTWGRELQVSTEELRKRYRESLQMADGGDIGPLHDFCRS